MFHLSKAIIFSLCTMLIIPYRIGFADSTDVVPLPSLPKYLTASVPTSRINNEAYSSLPTCPSTLVCLGPNAQSSATTCPEQCTVTRVLGPQVVTGSIHYYVSTIDAICPRGYAQVANYNANIEVINNPTGQTITPIRSMSDADTYYNAGWRCLPISQPGSPGDKGGTYKTTCGGGASVDSRGWTFTWNNIVNYAYMYDSSDCYYGANCGGARDSCSLATTKRLYRYHVIPVICTSPAGIYESGNMVPISVVCARVKSIWDSQ